MTRIFVPRGSSGASSSSSANPSRPPARIEPLASTPQAVSAVNDEESGEEVHEQVVIDEPGESSGGSSSKLLKNEDMCFKTDGNETSTEKVVDSEKFGSDNLLGSGELGKVSSGLTITENGVVENLGSSEDSLQNVGQRPHPPPPPPVPPPKPSSSNSNSRGFVLGNPNAMRTATSRRAVTCPGASPRPSAAGSRPSSPRSHCENDGYNSADEQHPCFVSSFDDVERERQFEIDIRRAKGLELKKMLEDGNCLFRAVADQVYGDSEAYDLTRQMCIDYMERERDHFSQFVTEGFTSYCKRKRRDKVYGNNVEIQALSEMYNRPIHIYSYGTEPINIFHGSYNTDTPPIRLSYHRWNHYNSLVDPRRLNIGAGLGFSSLRGVHTNIDKDQIKAAISAQQDQQIDHALLAEGQFYSDLELTEKEMERMVVEISRAEYLANDAFKQQHGCCQSSTSNAEPSSSGARSSGSETKDSSSKDLAQSSSVQMALSMGFCYMQVMEAYSIFGDDVDSIVCYLVETSSGRLKGKAAE